MTPDVPAICASLTKAQRFWVMQQKPPVGGGMWAVRNALTRKGLAERFSGQPTELSRQCAHILKEQQP